MVRVSHRHLFPLGLAVGLALAVPVQAQVVYSENFNGGIPSNGAYGLNSQIFGTSLTPQAGNTYIVARTAGNNSTVLSAGIYGPSSSARTTSFNVALGWTYLVEFEQQVDNLGNGPAAGPWVLSAQIGSGGQSFAGTGPQSYTARSFTYTPTANESVSLLFTFFNPENNPPGGYGYNAAFLDNVIVTGRQIEQPPVTAVPEPSAFALMSAGLAGMWVVSRRRRRI